LVAASKVKAAENVYRGKNRTSHAYKNYLKYLLKLTNINIILDVEARKHG
jgi:hypothetical protein